jgi:hypothetical protein
MTARRALVLGGTGMLAGVAAALLDDGWHVVLPSRRKPPGLTTNGHAASWVKADWTEPTELVATASEALDGPVDLLVAWVHREVRVSVIRAVAPLLADGAPIVEVHGSASANPLGGCPDPVLPDHPTQQVVLGYVRHAGRTRWLTHDEVSAGVLDAVHRALDGKPPHVHQVGEFRGVAH